MRNKVKKLCLGLLLVTGFCALTIGCAQPASAATKEELKQKTLLNNLRICFNGAQYFKYKVTDAQKGWEQLRGAKYSNAVVQIPTFVEETNGTRITCEKALNQLEALTGRAVHFPDGLQNLGYKPVHGSGEDVAIVPIRIRYTLDGKEQKTNTLNLVVNSDGVVKKPALSAVDNLYTINGADGIDPLTADNLVIQSLAIPGYLISKGKIKPLVTMKKNWAGNVQIDFRKNKMLGGSYSGVCSLRNEEWKKVRDCIYREVVDGLDYSNNDPKIKQASDWGVLPDDGWDLNDSPSDTYERPASQKGRAALRFFSADDSNTWNKVKFTASEELDLYNIYLEQFMATNSNIKIGDCSAKKDEAKKSAKASESLIKRGSEWCIVSGLKDNAPNDVYHKNVAAVSDDKNKLVLKEFGLVLDNVAKSSKYDNVASNVSAAGNDDDDDDDSNGDEKTSICHSAGKKIGWITCAAIEKFGDVIEGVYDWIEKDFLIVKPGFLSTSTNTAGGQDGGTYNGWKIFRDLANIVFAILFVVVIFSQLTGFGLDNYGVKRVLPRLIVVAILVNISFFLCQAAVDLSNIVGAASKNFLSSLVDDNTVAFTPVTFTNKLLTTLLTVGLGTGAAFAAVNWSSWLLPVMTVLVLSVISIVVFFLILGVRQAGVIIAVVVAPVAIVCYALPNTKGIFDKWMKIFKALLLVYPICGILMGGGQFASTLLVNMNGGSVESAQEVTSGDEDRETTGLVYNLVAMMISVMPFFFVPSILKSSMAALGNIGDKMSNIGSRFQRWSGRQVRNSEAYKRAGARLGLAKANNIERRRKLVQRASESQSKVARAGGFVLSGFNKKDKETGRRDLRGGAVARGKRLTARYNAIQSGDIEALTDDIEALRPGTHAYEARMADARAEADSKAAARQQAYYESQGYDTDISKAKAEYKDVLSQLRTVDPNSNQGRTLMTNARALHSILGKNSAGRTIIADAQAEAWNDSMAADPNGTISAGLQAEAAALKRSMGGVFKDEMRGHHEALRDAAQDGQLKHSFSEGTDGHYFSGYNTEKLNKLSSETLNSLNPDSMTSTLDQLRSVINDPGASAADQATAKKQLRDLANMYEDAMLNPNVTMTDETRDIGNMIRAADATYGLTADEAAGANATNLQRAQKGYRMQALEVGQTGNEFKIMHAPSLPSGWQKSGNGQWIDTRNNFNPLTADQVEQAETILKRRREADAHNSQWLS